MVFERRPEKKDGPVMEDFESLLASYRMESPFEKRPSVYFCYNFHFSPLVSFP